MKRESYFSICSSKAFWLKETAMHPRLNAAWKAAVSVEGMEASDVQALRSRKLAVLLSHAVATVPFYQKWLRDHGLDAAHLRLADFPILSKADIRNHEDEFVSSAMPRRRIRWSRTSGSTGEPFRFGKSEYDYTYATLWRGLARFGIRPGDRRALVKGVDETPVLSLHTRLRRTLYGWLNRCIVIDAHFLALSDRNVENAVRRLLAYRPAYLHGYASSIYLLARYVEGHGLDVSSLSVKAVVTESEKCLDFQRELMERVFQAPVVENYGSVEFGMIAQPARDGALCINEDHVYAEATPEGEAVFTNLDEYGFPLIRFKNGDLLRLGPPHPSLPWRTIASLDGRKTEMIRLPQGGALQGFIVMHPLYKHAQHLRAYQIYQPRIDRLVIRMAPLSPLPDAIRNQILSEMRGLVGPEMRIDVEMLEHIPLSRRGKRMFVFSDVERDGGSL